MTANQKNTIRKFFDKKSKTLDCASKGCPILMYEQEVRQKTVAELIDPRSSMTVLDLGCGNAGDILLFCELGASCIGVDLSKEMILEGKRKLSKSFFTDVDLIVADINALPFRESIFRTIACSEVLEHIPDYAEAIAEVTRILRDNGVFVVTTPNKIGIYGPLHAMFSISNKVLGRRSPHPFDKWKTPKELLQTLNNHSFEVEELMGVCYIPSEVCYWLPLFLKKIILLAVRRIEPSIRNCARNLGYCVAISARKVVI